MALDLMKLFKNALLVMLLSLLGIVGMQAQTKVTGTVIDASGEPLIGVQVIPVGATQSGALTDLDGNYTVTVPKGIKEISYSYVGYATQKIAVAGKKKIDVTLQEDTKVLEAVVVTAMGIKRKSKTLTYATQSVDNKELTRVQDANFVNALQGKTSGLTITPNSGGAGSASKILLRGNASIQGKNAPLIVVDGVPMSNNVASQTNGYSMGYQAVSEGSDPLSSINPDDIANINILKGPNAAALYGSDAANGVIIITTKSGREGSLKVDFSTNIMTDTPMKLPKFQNKYGATYDTKKGNISGTSWGEPISESYKTLSTMTLPQNTAISDKAFNVRDFFNVGFTMNNSVSISGGTKMVQSYFSASNTTATGMMPGNKFQRNGATLREVFNLFDGKLKIDVSGNYTYQTANNQISGGTVYNPLYNLYLAPRNLDLAYYKRNIEREATWVSNPITIYPIYNKATMGNNINAILPREVKVDLKGLEQVWFQGRGVNGANSPYWLVNRMPSEVITQKIFATLAVNYTFNPMFDIVFRANYDRNISSNESKTYATTVDPSGVYIDKGYYGWGKNHSTNFYTDGMLNYHQQIASDFMLNASLGGSYKRFTGESFWMRNLGPSDRPIYRTIEDIPTKINLFTPTSSYGTNRSYSLPSDWSYSTFATASLGWKEKVYLDASYRLDWSRAFSQFGGDVDPFYGYFSVGANALLNELVALPKFIDQLKLRASLSEVGNSIPNFNFGALNQSISGAVQAAQYAQFSNPKPETVLSFEAGFDLAALNNRLNWDVTYYNSTMYNQFLPITGSSGTLLPINSGEIRNQGLETTLSYSFNITKDLYWRTSLNYAYNTNKILKTYKGRDDIFVKIGNDDLRVIFKEGGSYGDIYAIDFARYTDIDEMYGRQQNGRAVKVGEIKLSSDGQPMKDNSKGHKLYLGNMNAKHTFGWSNTFSYKNFDLYFLIDGKIGGKVISFTEAYLDGAGVSERSGAARDSKLTTTVGANAAVVPAIKMPDGNLAPAEAYYSTIGSQLFASQYVYDATNLRLREVSLGYTFRNLLGNGKNLSLSLMARNLLFLYVKAPVDPDVSMSTANALGGVDIFNMPTARQIGMNVKLSF